MKKYIKKLSFCTLLILSVCCFSYVNTVESQEVNSYTPYENITESADRMVSSVKTATIVIGKAIDYLTKRELS